MTPSAAFPPVSTVRNGGVRIEQVTKRFGTVDALRGVSLDVPAGSFFSLLGPSGCGKTTLLRIIAGFEEPDAGRVFIGGNDVTLRTPQRRPTAMVFQNYALFPTMTVGENVAYGLRVRKMDRAAVRRRVEEVLARVDLAGLADKPVPLLSGGQQQRVALARAIAVEPEVLLFDEPLSNLDVALREQTRRELKELQARLGLTSIYVTHDQQEALALSDHIAVLRAGEVQQTGTPELLYREPATAYVAQFLGGSNVVTAPAVVAALTGGQAPPQGHALAVRPEHLDVTPDGPLEGRVRSRQFLGTHAEWWVTCDDTSIRVWTDPGLEVVDPVRLDARHYRWVRIA